MPNVSEEYDIVVVGAGHAGCEQVTVQNLEVVKVDVENNVILVKGAVPGPKKSLVIVRETVKSTK